MPALAGPEELPLALVNRKEGVLLVWKRGHRYIGRATRWRACSRASEVSPEKGRGARS